MKTPIQELIEKLDKTIGSSFTGPSTWSYIDAIQAVRKISVSMLEKEREVIETAYEKGMVHDIYGITPKEYYNETFNTKEK